ncbi:hypothetical protein D3C87_1761090 [compost metagenome]
MVLKKLGQLERPAHAQPCDLPWTVARDVNALQEDLAARGLQVSGADVDERRFSGAVCADHRQMLSAVQREVDLVGRVDSAKAQGQPLGAQQFRAG